MEKIPKIIHQTWKDANVPLHLYPLAATWIDNHPDWEYILWTDDMNRDFIAAYYPDFLPVYDNYPHAIQRVDAVRYLILYELGGAFIDLDFECLCNIESLLQNHECVLGVEPLQHCQQYNRQIIVCNAFMASTPKNDFFKAIHAELKLSVVTPAGTPAWKEILGSTGPFKLTEIYEAYPHKSDIRLLPSSMIYPLTLKETRELIYNDSENVSAEIQIKIEQAYAVHYFLGSWWE
jgi:mannosyltransferase OCH1-like enzyme